MSYASTSSLPDIPHLTRGLEVALGTSSAPLRGVQVLERRQNIHASSLPSEFITCETPDGEVLNLFCKYTGDDFEDCYGHRGSAGYEAGVYQKLVNPLGVAAPRCFGSGPGADEQRSWLFIEELDDVERITEFTDQRWAMRAAAAEIGRFQRLSGTTEGLSALGLADYDRAYFSGWIGRTVKFAESIRHRVPWLEQIEQCQDELIEPLLSAAQTVIHGEFYPHNVLCRDGEIFLVDWQSTAIGPGEIDLAALTENWPDDIVSECTQAYIKARWPGGAPPEFESTLEAARQYLVFRWLGDRPKWTLSSRSDWRFDQLRTLAERMGLT